MQLTEMFEEPLATGEDFALNAGDGKGIKIRMPKVRDIIKFGEPKYYRIIYAFAATSSDYTITRCRAFTRGRLTPRECRKQRLIG